MNNNASHKSPKPPSECPQCGDAVNLAYQPFCSVRCRDADLCSWLNGDYAISRDINGGDLEDPTLHQEVAKLKQLGVLDPYDPRFS